MPRHRPRAVRDDDDDRWPRGGAGPFSSSRRRLHTDAVGSRDGDVADGARRQERHRLRSRFGRRPDRHRCGQGIRCRARRWHRARSRPCPGSRSRSLDKPACRIASSSANRICSQTNLREASVVTLYLQNAINLRLRPKLIAELKPGTRVVSHAFDMGTWVPDETRTVSGRMVFLWKIRE